MKIERELMRGAGPAAVLQLLSTREMYGYQLVEALAQRSDGVLAMGQSTLYPMLYNLEAAESGRDRKYYRLTEAGRARLVQDRKAWAALTDALTAIGVVRGAAR